MLRDGSLADEACTPFPELSHTISGELVLSSAWVEVKSEPFGDHLLLRWKLQLHTHQFLPAPPLCSKSSGSAALLALSWTCLLVRIVFPSRAKRQGDIWNKLVGSLGLWSNDGQLCAELGHVQTYSLCQGLFLVLGDFELS